MSVSQKRARLLAGGSYKGTMYEPAKVLRVDGENILFRRTKRSRGNSIIQVLGLVSDSDLGEFELEYLSSSGKWVKSSDSPVKEKEPQIWEFTGGNDAEYEPLDFRGNQEIIKDLLGEFTEGPVTFFHE